MPIVRKTGGLADTVFDTINGFSFDRPDVASCETAVDTALQIYRQDKKRWKQLVEKGMQWDFS